MNNARFFTTVSSPVGRLTLVAAGDSLVALYFDDDPHAAAARGGATRDDRGLRTAATQLDAYFAGTRTTFDLPLAPEGTAFQKKVWAALRRDPLRRHDQLRPDRARDRKAGRLARHRRRQPPQPDRHHRPLPPRDRRRRLDDRLRRRPPPQAVAPRSRVPRRRLRLTTK